MRLRCKPATLWVLVMGCCGTVSADDGLLPVEATRMSGEVRQIWADEIADIRIGARITPGASLFSGADGRIELSLNDAPTLSMGGNSAALMHSAQADVLKVALTSGTLVVDTRIVGKHAARDVRLNVGAFRARVENARIWAEKTPEFSQICLVDGVVEFRANERPLRLEVEGQCVRQLAKTRQWNVVPREVLSDRVALTRVTLTQDALVAENTSDRPAEVEEQAAPVPLPVEEVAAVQEPEERAGSATATVLEVQANDAGNSAGEQVVSPVDGEAAVALAPAEEIPLVQTPPEAAPSDLGVESGRVSERADTAADTELTKLDAEPEEAGEVPSEPEVPDVAAVVAEPEPEVVISELQPDESAIDVAVAAVPGDADANEVAPTEPGPVVPAETAVVGEPESAPEVVISEPQRDESAIDVAVVTEPSKAEPSEGTQTEPEPSENAASQEIASLETAAETTTQASAPVVEGQGVELALAEVPVAAKPPRPWAREDQIPEAPPPAVVTPVTVEGPEDGVEPESAEAEAVPVPDSETRVPAPEELGSAAVAVAVAIEARQKAIASGEIEKVFPPGELAAEGDDRRWSVVVASTEDVFSAEEEVERLKKKGLDVEARPYRSEDREGYRIGIGRYTDKAQAEKALQALLKERPLLGAWLARY